MTQPPDAQAAEHRKPTRGQRAIAFGFIGAFALTMLTVILTGLYVRSPRTRAPETEVVTLTIGEPRSINLVFDSRAALPDVEFTVDLPIGIELADHPGQRRVVGRAELSSGSSALPLTLVAREGPGGQLAARLRSGDEQKTFVVDVAVAAR
ncbi:MAG TPA: hypothetical protein VIQ99_03890 [Gammaproteobacteria bacterium]